MQGVVKLTSYRILLCESEGFGSAGKIFKKNPKLRRKTLFIANKKGCAKDYVKTCKERPLRDSIPLSVA